jgi:uncharacterized protein YdhG (YjbR/CyaY superfamily)
MEKTKFATVDQYLSALPPEVRRTLESVRQTIRAAVPEAEEVISYQVPAFKYHGWLLYLHAHTHHYSLSCPPPSTVFEVFREELSPYMLSKSAIRLPLSEPIPAELISRIARFRAQENQEIAAAKTRKSKAKK